MFRVGHHAVHPCRLGCPMRGRRKRDGKHYYPAHTKPKGDYDARVPGCEHPDVSIRWFTPTSPEDYNSLLKHVMESTSKTNYEDCRKETGIAKPSIFSGLDPNRTLGIPGCFTADLMHLASLNLPDLFISLWRGTIECDETDSKALWPWLVLIEEVWKRHGQDVAAATPYLPGSFDRPPRNIAEKLTSGYKAWEFLTYFYGFAPALLKGILPEPYWANFCKLVAAIRLLHQREIENEELEQAHTLLVDFVQEYEAIYYQQREDRLHFCRPSIHALPHLVPEAYRVGPSAYLTQWTLERVIGLLGGEIKQPSNPYANLSQRAVQWCQNNALQVMVPELDTSSDNALPRGAIDIEDGYILLRARERYSHPVTTAELQAIRTYRETHPLQDNHIPTNPNFNRSTVSRLDDSYIRRWARLRLPNGQTARSAWKETLKPLDKVRMSRNVKVHFQKDMLINVLLLIYTNIGSCWKHSLLRRGSILLSAAGTTRGYLYQSRDDLMVHSSGPNSSPGIIWHGMVLSTPRPGSIGGC